MASEYIGTDISVGAAPRWSEPIVDTLDLLDGFSQQSKTPLHSTEEVVPLPEEMFQTGKSMSPRSDQGAPRIQDMFSRYGKTIAARLPNELFQTGRSLSPRSDQGSHRMKDVFAKQVQRIKTQPLRPGSLQSTIPAGGQESKPHISKGEDPTEDGRSPRLDQTPLRTRDLFPWEPGKGPKQLGARLAKSDSAWEGGVGIDGEPGEEGAFPAEGPEGTPEGAEAVDLPGSGTAAPPVPEVQGINPKDKAQILPDVAQQRPDSIDMPEGLEEDALAMQRAAVIARASSPLIVTHKAPEIYYSILVVGGYKTGKSIFLKMLKSLFASRAGCTTSCTDFSSDVVTVISSVSDATTTRHTFEFREMHVVGPEGGIDVRDLLAYINHQQRKYQSCEQDAHRRLPMSELPDKRIDLVLWLMNPNEISGHEAEQLHAVWQSVPIIPIISKADTLLSEELEGLRAQVINAFNRLPCWKNHWSMASIILQDQLQIAGAPESGIFAVVNSDDTDKAVTSCGWPVRQYTWGRVEPLLACHSDLLSLTCLILEVLPPSLKLMTEARYLADTRRGHASGCGAERPVLTVKMGLSGADKKECEAAEGKRLKSDRQSMLQVAEETGTEPPKLHMNMNVFKSRIKRASVSSQTLVSPALPKKAKLFRGLWKGGCFSSLSRVGSGSEKAASLGSLWERGSNWERKAVSSTWPPAKGDNQGSDCTMFEVLRPRRAAPPPPLPKEEEKLGGQYNACDDTAGKETSWEDRIGAAAELFDRLSNVETLGSLQEVLHGALKQSGGDLSLLMMTWFVYVAEVYDPPISRSAAKAFFSSMAEKVEHATFHGGMATLLSHLAASAARFHFAPRLVGEFAGFLTAAGLLQLEKVALLLLTAGIKQNGHVVNKLVDTGTAFTVLVAAIYSLTVWVGDREDVFKAWKATSLDIRSFVPESDEEDLELQLASLGMSGLA